MDRGNLMDLAADLDGAVLRGEIVAVYQPQVDMHSGRIVGVEALARWNHPDYGPISPATFIPIAEEHELISEIGDFMIDEGCRCASEWNSLGHRVDVAVNVSAAQLLTLDFLDRVSHNLARFGLAPDRIVIEVTESLPVVDRPGVAERLYLLRDLGLGISIDDYGTGYSSLERFATVPATEIKLDQSLIQDEADAAHVLSDAVEEAHAMRVRVVAEGIETDDQLERARALGCDRAQGYLFSRPVGEADIVRLLSVN
jgi:EAL domain-containing protein (putative c-di-GMP-specific phosphodiesterase class I)